MGRFILRFTGCGAVPAADVARIKAAKRLTVLEASARMLLVEAGEQEVAHMVESLEGWSCSPERAVRLPDLRPKPRRRPQGRSKS